MEQERLQERSASIRDDSSPKLNNTRKGRKEDVAVHRITTRTGRDILSNSCTRRSKDLGTEHRNDKLKVGLEHHGVDKGYESKQGTRDLEKTKGTALSSSRGRVEDAGVGTSGSRSGVYGVCGGGGGDNGSRHDAHGSGRGDATSRGATISSGNVERARLSENARATSGGDVHQVDPPLGTNGPTTAGGVDSDGTSSSVGLRNEFVVNGPGRIHQINAEFGGVRGDRRPGDGVGRDGGAPIISIFGGGDSDSEGRSDEGKTEED